MPPCSQSQKMKNSWFRYNCGTAPGNVVGQVSFTSRSSVELVCCDELLSLWNIYHSHRRKSTTWCTFFRRAWCLCETHPSVTRLWVFVHQQNTAESFSLCHFDSVLCVCAWLCACVSMRECVWMCMSVCECVLLFWLDSAGRQHWLPRSISVCRWNTFWPGIAFVLELVFQLSLHIGEISIRKLIFFRIVFIYPSIQTASLKKQIGFILNLKCLEIIWCLA